MDIKAIIQKLYDTNDASREELLYLLDNIDEHSKKFLIEKAYETRYKYFKNTVLSSKFILSQVKANISGTLAPVDKLK